MAPSPTPIADTVFTFYFASHIPVTAILEPQLFLPEQFIPAPARDLLQFYIKNFKDPLMQNQPLWFKALVSAEVLIQLPFFFYAIRAFRRRDNGVRIPAIVYAAHALTQMLPILATIFFDPATPKDRTAVLAGCYLPYFFIPLWLLIHMIRKPVPFPAIDPGDTGGVAKRD